MFVKVGAWKSVEELENSVTIEELYKFLEAIYREEHRHNKFMAALKGIDLDEGQTNPEFEEIKKRVQAELSGKSEEQSVFEMVGIEYDDSDEDY